MAKLLFLAASPLDASRTEHDQEFRAIAEEFGPTGRAGIELVLRGATRPEDIVKLLGREKPEILHISMHCDETGQLLFVGEDGHARPIPAAILANAIARLRDNLILVVLNGCQTEALGDLIAQHIASVVATTGDIDTRTAARFAAAFYHAVIAGETFRRSFDESCASEAMETLELHTPYRLLECEPGAADRSLQGSGSARSAPKASGSARTAVSSSVATATPRSQEPPGQSGAHVDDDDKDVLRARVLPLLLDSAELTRAVLEQLEPGYDKHGPRDVLARNAAEAVIDVPELRSLILIAEKAVQAGVARSTVWELFSVAIRGCAEFAGLVAGFRAQLLQERPGVLAFPVRTAANAEMTLATGRDRPPVMICDERGERVGASLVRPSPFSPDARRESHASAGDALVASVVCALASRYQVSTIQPDDVHAFLSRERSGAPDDGPTRKVAAALRSIDYANSLRHAKKSAKVPPFYVAVLEDGQNPMEQQAGLETLKHYLPNLDVGVLKPDIAEIELAIIDALETLIE